MLHPTLKRLDSSTLFVTQSAMDRLVETARHKIGLKAKVNGLRAVLVHGRAFTTF
jgi:hypothetical protein